MRRYLATVPFVRVTILAFGCGGASNKHYGDRGPVRGRVTLDGAPLAKVQINFENPSTYLSINVTTDDDGRYELKTADGVGLPKGTYRVAVLPKNTFDSSDELAKHTMALEGAMGTGAPLPVAFKDRPEIDSKYRNPETSGFTIEVSEKDNPPFDFDLKIAK